MVIDRATAHVERADDRLCRATAGDGGAFRLDAAPAVAVAAGEGAVVTGAGLARAAGAIGNTGGGVGGDRLAVGNGAAPWQAAVGGGRHVAAVIAVTAGQGAVAAGAGLRVVAAGIAEVHVVVGVGDHRLAAVEGAAPRQCAGVGA